MKPQNLTLFILAWVTFVMIVFINYGRNPHGPKPNSQNVNYGYHNRLTFNRNSKFLNKMSNDSPSPNFIGSEKQSKYGYIGENDVENLNLLKSGSEKQDSYDGTVNKKNKQNGSVLNTGIHTDKPILSLDSNKVKHSSQIIHGSNINSTPEEEDGKMDNKSSLQKPYSNQQDKVLNTHTDKPTYLFESHKDKQSKFKVIQKSKEGNGTESLEDKLKEKLNKMKHNRQQDVRPNEQTIETNDVTDEKSNQIKHNRQQDVRPNEQTTETNDVTDEKSNQIKHNRQQDVRPNEQTTETNDVTDEKSNQIKHNKQQDVKPNEQTTKANNVIEEKSNQIKSNRQQDVRPNELTTKADNVIEEKSNQIKHNRQQDVRPNEQTTKANNVIEEKSNQIKHNKQQGVRSDDQTAEANDMIDEKSNQMEYNKAQKMAQYMKVANHKNHSDETTNQLKHNSAQNMTPNHNYRLAEKSNQNLTKNVQPNIRRDKTLSLPESNIHGYVKDEQETREIYKTGEADDQLEGLPQQTKLRTKSKDEFDNKMKPTKRNNRQEKTILDERTNLKSKGGRNTYLPDIPALNENSLFHKSSDLNQTKQQTMGLMIQTRQVNNTNSDLSYNSNLQSDVQSNQKDTWNGTEPDNNIDNIPDEKLNILLKLIKSLYHEQLKDLESSSLNQSLSDRTNIPLQQTLLNRISYIIENPHICSSKTHINVLIFVETSLKNKEQRMVIRETWARKEIIEGLDVKVIFVLGTAQGRKKYKINKAIAGENSNFGDIIQGDFIDSYRNLTLKGILAFQWISEHCSNIKFIIKVDDDIFINIFTLLYHVSFYKDRSRSFLCHYRPKGSSIIQRGDKGLYKWAVDDQRFDGMKYFPVPYCFGYFVMLTSDLVPELIKQVPATPLFWIEDIYLYGLLPSKLYNVHYESISEHLSTREVNGVLCLLTNIHCKILATWASSGNAMNLLWFVTLNNAMKIFKDNKSDVLVEFIPLLNKELHRLRTKYKQEKPTKLLAIFNRLGLL